MRVAVVGVDGQALMPTTPARARKMVRDGVAEGKWSRLGTYYIQMLRPVGVITQPMAGAHDPGSKFEGWAVTGTREVALLAESINPQKIGDRCVKVGKKYKVYPGKMSVRRNLRRARRHRNCRRRPCRPRTKGPDWLAPSQRAKVELRERIAAELSRLYPITVWVAEDVRIDGNELVSKGGAGKPSHKGRMFSTAMGGKRRWYAFLSGLAPLVLRRGWEVAEARKEYGLPKSSDKGKLAPEAHATDALAAAADALGLFHMPEWKEAPFVVWRRFEFARRSLQRQNYQKGGVRPRFGGTTNGGFWRKGDYVEAEKAGRIYRGWVCGLPTEKTDRIGVQTAEGKRIGQFSPRKVRLLARSRGLSWQTVNGAPPHACLSWKGMAGDSAPGVFVEPAGGAETERTVEEMKARGEEMEVQTRRDAETPFRRLRRKLEALQELGQLIRESQAALKDGRASRALGLLARAQAITPDRSVQLVEWETDVLLSARDDLSRQLDDALCAQAQDIVADRVYAPERLGTDYLAPVSREAEGSDRETEQRIVGMAINALVKAAEREQQMGLQAKDRGRAVEPW